MAWDEVETGGWKVLPSRNLWANQAGIYQVWATGSIWWDIVFTKNIAGRREVPSATLPDGTRRPGVICHLVIYGLTKLAYTWCGPRDQFGATWSLPRTLQAGGRYRVQLCQTVPVEPG
jgi:hypothetical protein